jgi:hypothetical protein
MAILVLLSLAVVLWRSGAVSSVLHATHHPKALSTRHSSPPGGPTLRSSTAPTPTGGPVPSTASTPGPINTAFPGLTTFRGNATRDYYGEGPLPVHPVILWRYPTSGELCARSVDAGISGSAAATVWCGTGWTGQPNVIQHPNGAIEIREGAYDDHYHFLNGRTGRPVRPDLVTGDLAKGSATSDAEGYPLYYGGSRDNFLRVIALDRPKPTVLWSLNADTSVPDPMWNNDWDGAPLEIGDYLLEGGENSWFYVIRLNRHYDSRHKVQVDPKVVMAVPGWDQEQLNAIGDTNVSIEDSVAFYNGVAYFSNSGGLVQGWDISDILKGGTHYRRVFRFFDGDENDASIVIDPQGYLYVSRHVTHHNSSRPQTVAHQIGSLAKLDPSKPADPVVWSRQIGGFGPQDGILGTPGLYKGIVYTTVDEGGLVALNATTGRILWHMSLPGPTWGSTVPVDDQLLVGDCSGVLHDFDISQPRRLPREIWHVQLSGCIESTPAVWHGKIWVGARGGQIYGIGDPR